jgi:hypothetical protein
MHPQLWERDMQAYILMGVGYKHTFFASIQPKPPRPAIAFNVKPNSEKIMMMEGWLASVMKRPAGHNRF